MRSRDVLSGGFSRPQFFLRASGLDQEPEVRNRVFLDLDFELRVPDGRQVLPRNSVVMERRMHISVPPWNGRGLRRGRLPGVQVELSLLECGKNFQGRGIEQVFLQSPCLDPATGPAVAAETRCVALQSSFKNLQLDSAKSNALLQAAQEMTDVEFSSKTGLKGTTEEAGGILHSPPPLSPLGQVKLWKLPEIAHEFFVPPLD